MSLGRAPAAIDGTACVAPSASLYFDQLGIVRACCQNTAGALGNIAVSSIREIWDGAGTARLRSALARHDYSVGCDFCAWQVDEGNIDTAYARTYDDLDAVAIADWPRQMEFALSNACNLQCVMCNGDWSSSIRAHREHRPPLTSPYGDPFFDE